MGPGENPKGFRECDGLTSCQENDKRYFAVAKFTLAQKASLVMHPEKPNEISDAAMQSEQWIALFGHLEK